MASMSKRPGGFWIFFKGIDGRRRTLRTGIGDKRTAEGLKTKVELILDYQRAGEKLPPSLSDWLADLPDELAGKFHRAGLAPQLSRTLVELTDAWLKSNRQSKDSTHDTYRQTVENLHQFFGSFSRIREVTPERAVSFRDFLDSPDANRREKLKKPLAPATITRRIKMARHIFRYAVDQKWLAENPFKGLKGWTHTNPDRQQYIGRELFERVYDQLVCDEVRGIFLFARFAGLRCPSEVMNLRWDSIDWDNETITIAAPKTEHHRNKHERLIPIFEAIRPYLESREDREGYLFSNRRRLSFSATTNVVKRACVPAGVKVWPKFWQNLRASCETDLADRYPIQVVCAWLGNDPKIAMSHYLQVTKEHFKSASGNTQKPAPKAK